MKDRRVGILIGCSAKREVSIATGEEIFRALTDRGYDARHVPVDRVSDDALREQPIGVAFLALHGTYGEGG